VVVKFGERLVVSKQAAQKCDVERFNLKKISEMRVRRECQINISNRSEDLYSEDINRASKNTKENIKTSATESLGLYELNLMEAIPSKTKRSIISYRSRKLKDISAMWMISS
jgi:hypothetical protein